MTNLPPPNNCPNCNTAVAAQGEIFPNTTKCLSCGLLLIVVKREGEFYFFDSNDHIGYGHCMHHWKIKTLESLRQSGWVKQFEGEVERGIRKATMGKMHWKQSGNPPLQVPESALAFYFDCRRDLEENFGYSKAELEALDYTRLYEVYDSKRDLEQMCIEFRRAFVNGFRKSANDACIAINPHHVTYTFEPSTISAEGIWPDGFKIPLFDTYHFFCTKDCSSGLFYNLKNDSLIVWGKFMTVEFSKIYKDREITLNEAFDCQKK